MIREGKGKLHTLDIGWEIDDSDTVSCHTLIYQVETVIFRFAEYIFTCLGVETQSSVSINHKIIGENQVKMNILVENPPDGGWMGHHGKMKIEVFSFVKRLVCGG